MLNLVVSNSRLLDSAIVEGKEYFLIQAESGFPRSGHCGSAVVTGILLLEISGDAILRSTKQMPNFCHEYKELDIFKGQGEWLFKLRDARSEEADKCMSFSVKKPGQMMVDISCEGVDLSSLTRIEPLEQ